MAFARRLLTQPLLAFVFLAAALGVRVLVPAGLMPARALTISFEMCGDGPGGSRTLHIPMKGESDGSCPWAALAAPGTHTPPPVMAMPTPSHAPPPLAADGLHQDERVPARLRPPAQGPPIA